MQYYRFCSGEIQLTILQNYVFRETFMPDGLYTLGVKCVTPVPAGGVFTPDVLYESENNIICVHQHVYVRDKWVFFFLSRCR